MDSCFGRSTEVSFIEVCDPNPWQYIQDENDIDYSELRISIPKFSKSPTIKEIRTNVVDSADVSSKIYRLKSKCGAYRSTFSEKKF